MSRPDTLSQALVEEEEEHAPALRNRPSLWAAWSFAVHVIVGTLVFIFAFAVAIGLDLLVQWCERLPINAYLWWLLRIFAYMLAAVDACLYCIFLLRLTMHTARELWYAWKPTQPD